MNETEAREMLRAAAATIDVPPGREIEAEAPRRLRWLLPVAAAVAVAAAIGVGVELVDQGDTERPEPATSLLPTFTRGFVPSPFGLDRATAVRELEEAGYQVEVIDEPRPCSQDRVIDVDPNPGVRLAEGSTVSITATRDAGGDCISTDFLAWALVDFAFGRGEGPEFAERVLVDVEGRSEIVTPDELLKSPPETSSSTGYQFRRFFLSLAGMAFMDPDPNGYEVKRLEIRSSNGRVSRCGNVPWPDAVGGRSAYSLVVTGTQFGRSCATLDVFRSGNKIDALVLRSGGRLVPFDEDEYGFAVNTPENQQAAALAMRFLGFAQGGYKFPDTIHRPVRLYLGNQFQKTIPGNDTDDRAAWEVCATYAEASCPFSPLSLLSDRNVRGGVGVVGTLPRCLDALADPVPLTEIGARDAVVLRRLVPGSSCAESWAVQLFYDDDYRLTAVNLLLGSP